MEERCKQVSNAAFAPAPICSMLRVELHKLLIMLYNCRRCAGTHYVDGMMLLVKTAEVAGGIKLVWVTPPLDAYSLSTREAAILGGRSLTAGGRD